MKLNQLQSIFILMGNIRQKPDSHKYSYSERHRSLSFATSSMCGWRPTMEDSHLSIYPFAKNEDMGLFAVFDGHGGSEVAIFARNNFEKCLLNNRYFINGEYKRALIETFLQIDQLMLTKLGQKELSKIKHQNSIKNNVNKYEGESQAGCTANVVLLTKDHIYCANAGDSRSVAAIRSGKQKLQARNLSQDHKPQNNNQKARIQKAGGIVTRQGRINNNLNLSRALGDFNFKRNKNLHIHEQMVVAVPDIIKIPRKDTQFVLIGCDGIWQRKDNQQMIRWISKHKQQYKGNLVKVLESLFDQELGHGAYDQFGMDNMTAILIEFHHQHQF